jgi:hypothetical protein
MCVDGDEPAVSNLAGALVETRGEGALLCIHCTCHFKRAGQMCEYCTCMAKKGRQSGTSLLRFYGLS